MAAKSGGKTIFGKSCQDTLQVNNFVEIALNRSVYEINMFLRFTQKFKMAAKWLENDFWENAIVGSEDTLWDKNLVEIAVARSVSEINTFLHFTQKFKMAAKMGKPFFGKIGGKMIFGNNLPVDSAHTLGIKKFVEIALACSISKINVFLNFTQKFKMAPKSSGKTIVAKTCQ